MADAQHMLYSSYVGTVQRTLDVVPHNRAATGASDLAAQAKVQRKRR